MYKQLTALYKSKYWPSFCIGVLGGAIAFLVIYGVGIINPTNVGWLMHSDSLEGSIDLTQHYMGWVFYRNSPWDFPLGLTRGIYSKPVSVVYTDSIPLFAFIFKVLSPILPVDFQYMGIYGLICYALMGGFGALVTRRFSDNIFINEIGAAFFVLSPVMLNRMYLHTALSAHFLIVAALCMWIYRDAFLSRKRYVVTWSVLLICATLINAYFTPMLFGILLCSCLQEIIAKVRPSTVIAPIAVPLILTLIASWAMGLFYGDTNASGSGGLDILSFNLNGFINPFTYSTRFGHGMTEHDFSGITYSTVMPARGLLNPYQNEGFSYLGLGVIVLCVVALVLLLSRMVVFLKKSKSGQNRVGRYEISYIVAVFIAFAVFTYLALSPRWTLGSRELLYIHYPKVIWDLLSTFRSTARFIWPVYYMIISSALIIVTAIAEKKPILMPVKADTYRDNLFKEKQGEHIEVCKIIIVIIMAALLLLQGIDLSDAVRQKHGAFIAANEQSSASDYVSPMQDSRWDELADGRKHVMIYSPTVNLYWDGLCAMSIEIFAFEHNMDLNMTYMSRDLTDYADAEVSEHFKTRKSGSTYPDTIYFFLNVEKSDLPDAEIYGLTYYELDGFTVAVDATK